MGRLDEAAKHKVVELRKAGLSFRKIKAVLELDNIKVSAQAIYLFLREFQGRPPGRVYPVDSSTSNIQAQGIGTPEKWSALHLQNIIRNSSQQSQQCGFITNPTNSSNTKQTGSCSNDSSSSSSQEQGLKEDEIKIVSVSSLATNTQTVAQASATRTTTSVSCSTGAITPALMRRRISPSPATSSMLAARKRILDKALSHRIKSFQQVASLLKRDQPCVQSEGLRNVVQQQSNVCNSNERIPLEIPSKGLRGTSSLRFSVQRSGPSICTPPPPPRVGIRLPSQTERCSVPVTSNLRLPIAPPSSQTTSHIEGNSSPQQTVQESRVPLQDQIQTLSSEVHVLGVAVRMLVEQQCRLEREQVQQTSIQKQILSTLQSMSSKIGCCNTVQQQQQQQQHKTPSPSASKSTSFSQDLFICSQGTYTQCSQTQPSFNTMDVLETAEPFKLPEFSPTSMNGFAACSSAESLPLISSPLYQEQNTQTHMPGFTPNYVSAYNQSNNQTFTENKLANFSNSCAVRTFQDCNISNAEVLSMSSSMQDQVNNIKVEGP